MKRDQFGVREILMIGRNNAYHTLIMLFLGVLLVLSACAKNEPGSRQPEAVNKPGPSAEKLLGHYVTEGYVRRAEGFDWVVVSILPAEGDGPRVVVRARCDRKRPSCSYVANAEVVDDHTLRTVYEGKAILFSITDETLTVATERESDSSILSYFCSGGGSLADTYTKIDGPLDETQLTNFFFKRTLSLQGVSFDIKASDAGWTNTLVIQPSGLAIDNRPVEHTIEGFVTNAEIEDLNSDGFPEVLIYVMSPESGHPGDVVGYSVNNGKSMSRIGVPDIHDNAQASQGYRGGDEFAIVETSLARRFLVFREVNGTFEPTGLMRQIQYDLVDGEASRLLKIVKIVEYPAR
jgi:hypothetical protein